MANPIAVYDLTIPMGHGTEEENTLPWFVKQFSKIAKKWVFQLERGASGYEHLQARISLFKKKRGNELKSLLRDLGGGFEVAHYSPTSAAGVDAGDFYCMKIDTRLDGPWSNKDETIQDLLDPPYVPRQVRETPVLRPWQQAIVDSRNVWDTRTINCLVDHNGNIGKSTLASHVRAFKYGRVLPPEDDTINILRNVCDMPTAKMYLFDMPRAMKKGNLWKFFSAVETLKDGYAYDSRNHFQEKVFDCPTIWIFTNKKPELRFLSRDRWRFWKVVDDCLVPVEDIESEPDGDEDDEDAAYHRAIAADTLNQRDVEIKFLRNKIRELESKIY